MKKIRIKRKTNKRIWIGILTVMLLSLIVAIEEFLYITSVDVRFARALERGLYSGLVQNGAEIDLRSAEGEKNFSFIEKEYDAVSTFRGNRFRNKKLGKAASDYINSLSACKEIIQQSDIRNYDKFWDQFSKPYGQRVQAIYNLYHGNYRLQFKGIENNKELKEELNELLLQGWALKKTETIQFVYKEQNGGHAVLAATIKNDSGYDLDYLDITVTLYDANYKRIETVSAFKNDIKSGGIVELYCYETVPGTTKNFEVSAVNCATK